MPDVRPVGAPLSRLTWLVAAIVPVVLLSACSGDAASDASPAAGAAGAGRGRGAAAAVMVTTASAVEKPMPVQVRVVGNVEASSSVDIRSQVSGELVSVGFEEGDDVTAGQVLFTLDPRPFEVALKQAEAALARTTAEAKGARAIFNRSEELFKKGLLPRSEREETNTDVAVADAAVSAAAAELENAKLQLTYTKIVAPVAGRTGALLVHPGSLVRANDATPLVVINQVVAGLREVRGSGPPAAAARRRPRARAQGAGRAGRQRGHAGRPAPSRFIDNAVDQATDTIRLKATFPNRDRRLWPGAFVDVTLQLSVEPTRGRRAERVGAGQPAGPVRLRREGATRPSRRARSRSRGSKATRPSIESGVKAGRDRRHRRPAAAHARRARCRPNR